MTARVAVVLCLVVAWGPGRAQEPAPTDTPATAAAAEAAADDVRAQLDAIRDDVVALRFEKALAAIDALLGRPGLQPAERAEALVLRAQTHASFGDFDSLEADYREILRLQPGWRPDPTLTPDKARQRFDKVQAATVGRLHIVADPPEAVVAVDGRAVPLGPEGEIAVLAGTHTVLASSPGFDPAERTVDVAAGKAVDVKLELTPNARSVVVRTEPAGVRVYVDGVAVGATERPHGAIGAGAPPGELTIENLPLGEHVFELRRECFRTERFVDSVAADLLDRSPKRYKTVQLVPVRSTVVPEGAPAGSEVWIDGALGGKLPSDGVQTCPGPREIRVVFAGRTVWLDERTLGDADTLRLDVTPRPNAALVGTDDWPRAFAGWAGAFNVIDRRREPPGGDLGTLDGWRALPLPAGVDVALAPLATERSGVERWALYSPVLGRVAVVDHAPELGERPRWTRPTWGFAVVDSTLGGAAMVVGVDPRGPGAAAGIASGSRLVRVGTTAADSAAAARRALAAADGEPVALAWVGPDGKAGQGTATPRVGPWLPVPPEDPARAILRAGWAALDAVTDAAAADAARANLALLFEGAGRPDLAAQTWARVAWSGERGIGAGTRQYYLGCALEAAGRESEARDAYREAAAGACTAIDDDGPRIAPAAADRLADLGVSAVSAR